MSARWSTVEQFFWTSAVGENKQTQLESEMVQAEIEPEQRGVRHQGIEAQDCERVQILQALIASTHLPGYGKRQAKAAQKLGITVASWEFTWASMPLVPQLYV